MPAKGGSAGGDFWEGVGFVLLVVAGVLLGATLLEKLAGPTCPRCGKPVKQGATSCPSCGEPLRWVRK